MTITNTTGRDCLDSRCPGPLTWERTELPRTGRPKTGPGHRDDAMMAITEFIGLLAEMRKLKQEHFRVVQKQYREDRALLDDMQERVVESAQSWRYGELVDDMMTERVA